MNKIYILVGKLRPQFVEVARSYTDDKTILDDTVQELMLYFLQMNPDTLKKIYEKDGELGILKYGNVALGRMFTSPRSKYYYKYTKYYTHVKTNEYPPVKDIDQVKHVVLYEKIDKELDKMYWYDRDLYYMYYSPEGETLDGLAKKTGISRNSLFTTIDNVRKKLIDKLKDE
mgnify:CR=1 FL=1